MVSTSSPSPLFTLGTLPAFWDSSKSHIIHKPISNPRNRSIEPVGPHFLAHARRKRHGRTFSEDERIQAEQAKRDVEEDIDDEEEEPEDLALLSSDPKDWRDQDHYAVLGLSKYRYKATDEQIKRSHRKKVLKHHPDKKASSGNVNDDAFFKCIQKAHEILSDPVKRRQFDSVDEGVPEDVPTLKTKGDFFQLYRPVFEREARFSNVKPVPGLGNANSSKEEVETFYDFWYNFDSWRSFEYLDKDESSGADNRDDKRYTEKKNKSERARRKKEDISRLRKLVDQTLSLDPRIRKFKEEEKAQKNAKKIEREKVARAAEEEKKRAEIEAKIIAEREAEEAKKSKEDAKKQKESAKRAVKKNRKIIKIAVKDNKYLSSGDQEPSAQIIEQVLAELDIIIGGLEAEDLERLVEGINASETISNLRTAIGKEASTLVSRKKAKENDLLFFLKDVPIDNTPAIKSSTTTTPASSALPTPTPTRPTTPGLKNIISTTQVVSARPWTTEEVAALVKAANKFPGGTVNRWETVSAWVSQHTNLPPRNSEELIAQTQIIKSGSAKIDMKSLQNSKAKSGSGNGNGNTKVNDIPTKRDAYEFGQQLNNSTTGSSVIGGWTVKQQTQLESALQKYPPNWTGKIERWEAIARTVDGKSKKECKERVKQLSAEIKASKAAAAATANPINGS